MLFRSSNMAEFALSKPLNVEPGSRWQYSSGTSNILARVFRDKFPRHAEYLAFPRRALFDPLEMHDAVLETDESGTYVGSSYMYATARQWARFGELYLNGGVWKGQRLLPEGWVEYSTMPAPSNLRRHYGAHFWLDVPEEYRKGADDLPPDAFHAVGHEAQFISVIPSRQLVIVRLGRTRYPEAWDHVDFVRQVMRATDRLGALE
jgi:hypothetical protein